MSEPTQINLKRCSNLVSLVPDAAALMAVRCARIARGGPAGRAEAQRLWSERLNALIKVQWSLLSWAYGARLDRLVGDAAQSYLLEVQANRKRLSKTA